MNTNRSRLYIFATLIVIIAVSIILLNNKNNDNKVFYGSTDSGYSLTSQKDSNNSSISTSRQTIITKTVKDVSPAVVGINVTEIRQYRDPFGSFFDDPFFRQFFGNRGNYNQKIKGLGSGFIISPDGYIVTNDHVAGNAAEITVTMTDGKQYSAKVVGTDAASDICLLKVDADDLPYEILGNSDNIMIGEWVVALGNPFGLFEINDKPTVTVGVISSTGMNLEPLENRYYLNMLQTDAAINGGNSGGPLVNSVGEVIGMNTLIYSPNGSGGNIGLSFAIPINKIKRIITELKQKGSIDRNFDVGFKIQSIDEGIADYYKLPTSKGVIVTYIASGSPADKAGLKVGDIIQKVNEYNINNENTLISVFQEFRVGQTITLKIIRDDKEIEKKMTLDKRQ